MANNNHFELTLDTLAPEGGIDRGNVLWHNSNYALTITKGDASFMYVWFDSSATTSEIPSGTSAIEAATSYTTQFTDNGNFYYHCVLMDDVGNKSAVNHTAGITYDTAAPTVNSVELCKRDGTPTEITTVRTIAVKFAAKDTGTGASGLASCAISGDINVDATAWSSTLTPEEAATLDGGGTIQRNIVLSGTDPEEATKTVSITVTDKAGNTSLAKSDTIYLDMIGLEGHIVLKSSDETKTITEQWVNVADFKILLDASNKADWKGYKVWGDFNDDGGATGTTEPATYTELTEAEKTAKVVKISKKWTSGDSDSKKVRAKLIDTSGIETTIGTDHGVSPAVDKYEFSKVDYSAPTVAVTIKDNQDLRIKTHVSKVSGFTTQVLVPTVDATISGAASYQWYMDGTEYPSGSGSGAPGEFTVDSANMGTEGAKVFTLKVTDNAGNSTTSSGTTIYLDTTAPTGSITMNAWYGGDSVDTAAGFNKFSTAGATASATDGPSTEGVASGMKYMTCWCSQTAADTTVVGNQKAYAADPAHGDINWDGHGESATNYIHIQYVDAVGNATIVHSAAFGIDTVCDQPGSVAFTKEAYPSTSASVVNTAPTSTSPIASFKVWGDITSAATEAAASWEVFANSKAVTLTTGDGTKNINIRYRDTAGNVSTGTAATDSTELDTSKPSITPSLFVSGTDTAKPAISNVKESDLRITVSDDATGKVFYQVYGDFTTDGTQAAQGLIYKACTLYAENTAIAADALVLYEGAVYKAKSAITAAENTGWSAISSKMEVNTEYWKEYVVDSGKQHKTIATVCTSGDGWKNFFARAMDNAGNITEQAETGFEYDTTAPVPTINDVDHNRISKVHTKRLKNASGTISELTTYNDETKFNTTCDSVFVEYKICAYVSLAAAKVGSHEDAAIPISAGSVNMSGTGTWGPGQTSEKVDHTIKGADYESALTTAFNTSSMTQAEAEAAGFVFADGEINAIDGAHIVVVYVKDQGGTWSVAANFEV